jgi:hypothetical protein
MHLLEISIFSLNNDLLRLTKIMNNLVKDLKIPSFKVIFQCLKLVESFQKKQTCEKYLIRRPTYINEMFWKKWFLKYFIYYKCAQFLSALFIILVCLMMTLFSEKVLLSHRCITGLMPILIKKSWTDSTDDISTLLTLCTSIFV